MTDERYMRPGLDFAVGKMVEECGELQAALGKTLRWGWAGVNPELPPSKQEPNASWVRREMADVRGALDRLEREMDSELPYVLPDGPAADTEAPENAPWACELRAKAALCEQRIAVEAERKACLAIAREAVSDTAGNYDRSISRQIADAIAARRTKAND